MRQCAKVYFQLEMEIQNGQKKYSKELKARIALDEIKVQKTIAELAPEDRAW
jgi:transposase-like protein